MNPAHCARPACYGKAAAWLAYDYDARCAWLDDDASDAGPQDRRMAAHVWPLCERHADNLRVPRGWFCVDRRASRFGPADGGSLAAAGTAAAGTAAAGTEAAGTAAAGTEAAGTAAGPGAPPAGGTRDNETQPGAPEGSSSGRAGGQSVPNVKAPGTKDQGQGPGTSGGGRLSSIL